MQGVVVHTLNLQQRGKGEDKVSQGLSQRWNGEKGLTFLLIPTHCTTLRLTPHPFSLPTCCSALYGAHKVFIDSNKDRITLSLLTAKQAPHGECFTEIFN